MTVSVGIQWTPYESYCIIIYVLFLTCMKKRRIFLFRWSPSGLIPVDFHFMLGKVSARYYFLYQQNIHIYLENPLSINFLPLAPVSYDFVILHQQIFQNIKWSGWIYLRAKYMKNEFELSIFEMHLQVEYWKGRCTYDALLPSMRWCSFLQWSELSRGNAE